MTYQEIVQQFYIAYYDRPADPAGNSFWIDALSDPDTGIPSDVVASANRVDDLLDNPEYAPVISQLIEYFGSSAEFTNLYGADPSASEFIDDLYLNILNRTPDAEGQTFWLGVYDGLVAEGMTDAEARAELGILVVGGIDGGSEADQAMFNNKVILADETTNYAQDLIDAGKTAESNELINFVRDGYFNDNLADPATFAAAQAGLKTEYDTLAGNDVGQTFTLTVAADTIPGLIGSDGTTDTSGDDTIVATDTTLSAADRIADEGGENMLFYGQSGTLANAANIGAFQMSGVQTLTATNDSDQAVSFDLSGTTGLTSVHSQNSSADVAFNQVTNLSAVGVESATTNANVSVTYQNALLAGADDTVNLSLSATNRSNNDVGTITLGSVATGNQGIENLALDVTGEDTGIDQINSDVTDITITGDGSALRVDTYFNSTLRSLNAAEFTGDLQLSIGFNTAESILLTADLGSGNDWLDVTGGMLDVDLSDGDDTILFDNRADFNNTNNLGFRADDSIDGGAGFDALQLGFFNPQTNAWIAGSQTGNGGTFLLSTTEFNNKTSLEVIDVQARTANMTLSQAFVDSAEQTLYITSDEVNVGYTVAADITAANIAEAGMTTTLDTTALNQNTPLDYVGGDGSDRIVLNDATFNSAIDLNGGGNWNVDAPPAGNGDYDTLNVVGGSTQTVIDAADLANIENFEGLNLVKQGSATTINLVLTQDFLMDNTEANDDVINTSIDDRVFQIFTQGSQNGTALSGTDMVNIDISDLVGVNLGGRGFDFSSLMVSGANITFTNNGVAATAAEVAAITVADPVGQPDVIASRANPVTADNVLVAEAAGFDTTSGFLIQGSNMATSGDDTLRTDNNELAGSTVDLAGGGNDTMELLTASVAGDISGAAIVTNVENLVLVAGGVVNANDAGNAVNVDAFNTITANASANVSLASVAGGQTFVGTAGAHLVNPGAFNDTITLNDGGNHVVTASIGNDSVTSGDGADLIFVQIGNDTVNASAGDDVVVADLAGGGSVHDVTLGAGNDAMVIRNAGVVVQGDANQVNISDFSVSDDVFTMLSGGNAVSDGIYHSDVVTLANPIGAGSIVEISGTSFTYTDVTNVNAVRTHLQNTSLQGQTGGVDTDLAVANGTITVAAYNGAGNAAIYLAADTTGDQNIDAVELVGVIDNVIGVDTLTSSNFT